MPNLIPHFREQIIDNATFLYPEATSIKIIVATTSHSGIQGFLVVDGAVIDAYMVDSVGSHETLQAAYRAMLFQTGEDVTVKIRQIGTDN